MQTSFRDHNSLLENGKKRYKEWADNLLSTPEAQAQFKAKKQEYDLLLQLIEARRKVGLTQARLAEQLGVSRARISRIEQYGFETCSLDLLQRYALAVGKTLQISLVSN